MYKTAEPVRVAGSSDGCAPSGSGGVVDSCCCCCCCCCCVRRRTTPCGTSLVGTSDNSSSSSSAFIVSLLSAIRSSSLRKTSSDVSNLIDSVNFDSDAEIYPDESILDVGVYPF